MTVHELKTDPDAFKNVLCGRKNFEIRRNDRYFKVGDLLLLHETVSSGEEMKNGKPLKYTGRTIPRIINYILPGGQYGIDPEFVVMDVVKI